MHTFQICIVLLVIICCVFFMFVLVHLVWSTWHWNVQKSNLYTVLNPINRQNIYIIMYVFHKRALPKLSIISYVCVTIRLKSVFATTNVHLYLDASSNPHYEIKSVPSQEYFFTLGNGTALHNIASKQRYCLVLYHRKINLELILPSRQHKIIV